MNQPLISVIIPAFNAAKYLGQAIASIQAQAYPNLEIVVVDDASQDATAEVVRPMEVQYICLPQNMGSAVARNTGIAQARGRFIAFLDADDEWMPNKLQLQLRALNKYPDLAVVTGYFQQHQHEQTLPVPKGFVPSFGTALIRREVFDQVGLCNPNLRMCDDLDWFNRAREQQIGLALIPQVCLLYRLHETNITNDQKQVNYWMARAFQERLRRFGGRPPNLAEVRLLKDL